MTKAIAVVSGGLDSVTMVYDLLAREYEVDMISFDYGQRHSKELIHARAIASLLNLRHEIVDLRGLTELISNSALTGDTEVPEGHYAQDNMAQTVVPNRNMIMLSIACGIAINRGANTIATAVHAGDHFIYPDCRPQFIFSLGQAMIDGNEGFHNFFTEREYTQEERNAYAAHGIDPDTIRPSMPITTPYLRKSKADIAYRALELDVPLHVTWSCYKGGPNHCGRCGTCVERLEAIDEALRRYNEQDSGNAYRAPELGGCHDFTVYDDSEYWKTVTIEKKVEDGADGSDFTPEHHQV
jgi:7-cyano-7-deazaguanine synthase